MNLMENLKVIARIYNDYTEKFGIPRQSNIIPIESKIIFEPEFRNADSIRGLEEFQYIWLLWEFTETNGEWSPTVRPPKLGGNTRKGVFATRSPFRPNPIGMSSVKLKSIEFDKTHGSVLNVIGADILNGTPIFDIKPYIKYADSHEDANNGFADSIVSDLLTVNISKEQLNSIPQEKQETLIKILAQDPRPAYKTDCNNEYGIKFAEYNIRFKVNNSTLTVTEVQK